jgi:hypothetical protein
MTNAPTYSTTMGPTLDFVFNPLLGQIKVRALVGILTVRALSQRNENMGWKQQLRLSSVQSVLVSIVTIFLVTFYHTNR